MEILRLNQISPDQVILFQWGFVHVSATLAYTWLIMGILLAFALLVGRRSTPDVKITRWQNLLEVVVLSLIHISEPTRLLNISYAVFCLQKKNTKKNKIINPNMCLCTYCPITSYYHTHP